LETRNGNIGSSGKPTTPKAEEGYSKEATQSGSLTHSQSHQTQSTVEHTEVKLRRAWTKEEIREVIWCYMHCRQRFTENSKKVYEKSFRKCMSNIPGKYEVKELQKTATLGTAHILRKILM